MQPSWVGVQTRKSYHDFVGQFDALVDTDVRWTPYTAANIYARAPSGLSSLCLRDHEYWMTRKPILYDIHVEEYHVNRVMRQFGLYQQTLVLIVHSVEPYVHKYRIYSSVNNLSFFYNLPFSIDSLNLCIVGGHVRGSHQARGGPTRSILTSTPGPRPSTTSFSRIGRTATRHSRTTYSGTCRGRAHVSCTFHQMLGSRPQRCPRRTP